MSRMNTKHIETPFFLTNEENKSFEIYFALTLANQ